MDNKQFGKQLEVRTKRFAVSIISLSASMPNCPESKVIRNQITKSGTSIGANYREANRARSKADFDWGTTDKVKEIIMEANELLAIFTSIGAKQYSKLKAL
jgi:four helix bundle protein